MTETTRSRLPSLPTLMLIAAGIIAAVSAAVAVSRAGHDGESSSPAAKDWRVVGWAYAQAGDAASSAGAYRKAGADGKLPPVGNTVDVPNATWTNTIGSPALVMQWQDPDFDGALRSFYYVRVIEIPTPRWTAYDARRFNVKMSKEVPMTTQERAYTSPIWYTPAS